MTAFRSESPIAIILTSFGKYLARDGAGRLNRMGVGQADLWLSPTQRSHQQAKMPFIAKISFAVYLRRPRHDSGYFHAST
ncbi:MAG: hypothetical protein HC890_17680 [Chloroflexaceae bacterium]|nr:hypothetical protein [Chloroflexaceae bacterium]